MTGITKELQRRGYERVEPEAVLTADVAAAHGVSSKMTPSPSTQSPVNRVTAHCDGIASKSKSGRDPRDPVLTDALRGSKHGRENKGVLTDGVVDVPSRASIIPH